MRRRQRRSRNVERAARARPVTLQAVRAGRFRRRMAGARSCKARDAIASAEPSPTRRWYFARRRRNRVSPRRSSENPRERCETRALADRVRRSRPNGKRDRGKPDRGLRARERTRRRARRRDRRFVTYFEILLEEPVVARVGIALSRDPSVENGSCVGIAQLGGVSMSAQSSLDLGTAEAASIAGLEIGRVLRIEAGSLARCRLTL